MPHFEIENVRYTIKILYENGTIFSHFGMKLTLAAVNMYTKHCNCFIMEW